MKAEAARTLRAFCIELAVYAVLVVAYFFAVLHFLDEWLGHLEMGISGSTASRPSL
jgi:hypothetical protein